MPETRKLKGNHRHTRAYIGLGSNTGDRVGYVQQAMQFLKDCSRIKVVECSSLYETEPIGDKSTEWFVNAVAAIDTDLTAEEVLEVCQNIERRLTEMHGQEANGAKRRHDGRKARIIDLDILFFGDHVFSSEGLSVPHPRIAQRAYALVPLLEIAPDYVHPGFDKPVTQLHEELPNPELVYLYGTRGMSA